MWPQKRPKKDEISYTEDGIPVRTVYISNLHPTVTKEVVETFFEKKFQCIESVHFHYNRLRSKPNVALITFTSAKVAAMALYSDLRLNINNSSTGFLRIYAAESWHQPTTPNDRNESTNNDDLEFSLLRLNDDCILHLYNFLTINDIENLSITCDRLRKLSEPIIKKKCEHFDFDTCDSCASKQYTLMNIRTIMTNLGHYIQCLTLDGKIFKTTNHSRYLEIVYSRCTNLQELHLNHVRLSQFDEHYYIDKPGCSLNHLKKLELHLSNGCFGDAYLQTKLNRSSNLIELKIYHSYGIHGIFFKSLKKLETIHIQKCESISTRKLKRLLISNAKTLTNVTLLKFHTMASMKELLGGSLKKLKYLNTDIPLYKNSDSTKLTGELNNIQTLYISHPRISNEKVAEILHELSVNNKQIVELDISGKTLTNSMQNDLLRLETLKIITVNGMKLMNSTFLINCAQKMKELCVLNCRKADISNANVVKIVEFAKTLIELDVFECENVTWNIIENIGEVLKKYNGRPKLKLKIKILKDDVIYEMILPKLKETYKTFLEIHVPIKLPKYCCECEDNDDDDDNDSFVFRNDHEPLDSDDYEDEYDDSSDFRNYDHDPYDSEYGDDYNDDHDGKMVVDL